MKLRDFNRVLRSCCVKGKLSAALLAELADDVRKGMVELLVRNRAPIVVQLIPSSVDESWLNACGYFYTTRGATSGFSFRHTSEHAIR